MAEEVYKKPKKSLASRLMSRARKAKLAPKETPREAVQRARRSRQGRQARLSSELLPDGLAPAMRASLSAAHRRAETDPARVELLERAKLTKRVQLAKREAGLSDAGSLLKFMGMDEQQHAAAVEECALPRPMSEFRPAPKAEKKPKKGKAK